MIIKRGLAQPFAFLSLLPLGEGPGMRVYERPLFFSYLCSGRGEWHSKTKPNLVDAALNPHPNPLPMGEGARVLAPSGRREKRLCFNHTKSHKQSSPAGVISWIALRENVASEINPKAILQSGARLEYRALSIRPKTPRAVRIVSLQRRSHTCFQKAAEEKIYPARRFAT